MQAEIRDNFQDALNDGALHLLAASSGTDEENAAWVEEIREAFPGVPLLYDNLSLGVSCHIGSGGMGIGWRWHRIIRECNAGGYGSFAECALGRS